MKESFKNLIKSSRSTRLFDENFEVSKDVLYDIVDTARFAPSTRNSQPIKYFISADKDINEKIFPELIWAGYLKDFIGPKKGERPSAYILFLKDENEKNPYYNIDLGICSQTIALSAKSKGLSACIIASIYAKNLKEKLSIEGYSVELVLALGKGAEKVEIVEIEEGGDIKYYRKDGIHYVPKRKLKDIIVNYEV